MANYQELMQAFKDQGISPDWAYQQRTQQYGSDGNSALDNYVDKIAPTLTFGGVNYSYDPDKQTFSSGGNEVNDPNKGWGRSYDLTNPEGTTQQWVRSKTDWEKLKPAVLALGGVLGLGALGPAAFGALGGEAAGTAAATGAAAESAGGLGALTSGVAAEGAPAYFSTGLGDTALSSGLPSFSYTPTYLNPTLGQAATSFGAAPLTLSGAQDALYNALTAGGGGIVSEGAGGSSGLKQAASTASKLIGGGGDKGGINPLVGGGLGALLGYLASRNQPKNSVDTKAIQMAIPKYEFSRNQQTPPAGFKPGVSPEPKYFDNKMVKKAAGGGISGLRPNEYKAGGQYLQGPGDGMSDNIRANIDGHQEARLADGEFVVPADVVSHIGNGSSNAGAKKLHAMMNRIRHARTGNPKQGKQIKAEKYLPA